MEVKEDSRGFPRRTSWRSTVRVPGPEVMYPRGEAQLARRQEEGQESLMPKEEGVRAQELEGLYIISVAARLLNMHPQTLRKYERMGLVSPSRTAGMLRLYSQEDITKLRVIKHMVEVLRLNLAGVEMALSMADRLLNMHRHLAQKTRESFRSTLQEEVEQLLELLNARFPRSEF